MKQRIWVILGATSIIAKEFAHLAAINGYALRLVGKDGEALEILAKDIELRFQVPCSSLVMDMQEPSDSLLTLLKAEDKELDLFIAHSDFTNNEDLNPDSITKLIKTNILATSLLIHHYLQSPQSQHHLVYLSSVAACRGRAKNSLYGASKAAIEVYLQGLQQSASKQQTIVIARLGFIDTKQTYGLPGIFYAAPPKECAKACWKAMSTKKRLFYYPGFWRMIMAVIGRLPFFMYRKMKV